MNDSATRLLELLEKSGRRVHNLLYKLTSRADVAEELMQELFVKLLRSQAFDSAPNQEAYLLRSAIHLAFDWRKSNLRDFQLAECAAVSNQPVVAPLDVLIEAETIRSVLTTLDQLSDQDRELICLRYLQEESYETIAAQFEITVHHARSRCSKAIARLRQKLELAPTSEQHSEGSRS